MIVTELVFLSILTIGNAIAGRCYLCSQDTLAECIGSNQSDSSIYKTVLQYYTEPCNGQCVLFRNENRSVIRGCSWTYGHMTSKSIGWHEISPGVQAYFCDSHLCNNGTYDQPEISMMKTGMINNQLTLSSEQLFILAGNNALQGGYSRQLHYCYSCTARFQGCGEFLDPHYASNYIRACPTSCIIFRNPNDLNLITRDCSIFWPQVHAKSGLHKLLGSDAFFCQESLCNGISFDFIMGIFHNQLPDVITFPPIRTTKNISTTTMNIYNDNVIWDDPDLDFVLNESTTPVVLNNSTSSFIDKTLPTYTIIDSVPTEQANLSLNWWVMNDTLLHSLSSTDISSTTPIEDDDDDWVTFNTSSIQPITRFEHFGVDNNNIEEINETAENNELTIDLNDYILSPISTTITPMLDLFTFLPSYLLNNKTKNELLEYIAPLSTLAIPPFSWMLNMAAQNKSQLSLNSTTTTTTTTTTTSATTTQTPDVIIYEYCKNKQCHHGGRLNSDCLCICLPTLTGDNCETVLCDEEPAHICAFILEDECQTNHNRYLCPKFCQIDICSSKKL